MVFALFVRYETSNGTVWAYFAIDLKGGVGQRVSMLTDSMEAGNVDAHGLRNEKRLGC